MVLEETLPPPTDFPSDSSPTSSPDPYASPSSSSSETPQLSIDLAQLPSAAPLFGPLFGYTTQYLAQSINYRIQHTTALMSRPVSPTEASALAYWTAKMLAIASWGRPLGLLAGGARAYQTRQTFRFPFVAPDPAKFQPELVKIAGVELLRGAPARAVWHGLRGGAYGVFGSWVGGALLSTYAAAAAAVGEQQDPRLREVVARLRAKAKEMARGVPRGGQRRTRTVGQEADPMGRGEREASELWKEQPRAVIGDDDDDDASPTAGDAEGFDYESDTQIQPDDARRLAQTDGADLADAPVPAQQHLPPRTRPRHPFPSPSQSPDFDTSTTTTNDDATTSPPATTSSSSSSSSTTTTASSSVWDRIRQEANSGAPSTRGRRPPPPRRAVEKAVPAEEEDGGFGIGGEEERRAEAQRVFDEEVERERRGGGFGGGRGW